MHLNAIFSQILQFNLNTNHFYFLYVLYQIHQLLNNTNVKITLFKL